MAEVYGVQVETHPHPLGSRDVDVPTEPVHCGLAEHGLDCEHVKIPLVHTFFLFGADTGVQLSEQ